MQYAKEFFEQQAQNAKIPSPQKADEVWSKEPLWLTDLHRRIRASSSRPDVEIPIEPIQTPRYQDLLNKQKEVDLEVQGLVDSAEKTSLGVESLDAFPPLTQTDIDNYGDLMRDGVGEVSFLFFMRRSVSHSKCICRNTTFRL